MNHADMSWAPMIALGAWHGINPGMGWLFAVALGLQEQRSAAVWKALPPLALGHALAVLSAVLVAAVIGLMLPADGLRWLVAAVLVGFGASRLVRHRHPRFGGMRVGSRDLVVWSALMASAHGAGLMVVPFVLDGASTMAAHGGGAHMAGMATDLGTNGLSATVVHTLAYLAVTGLLAVLVYERFGLKKLKQVWVNLDLVWGIALVVTGVLTPLL